MQDENKKLKKKLYNTCVVGAERVGGALNTLWQEADMKQLTVFVRRLRESDSHLL